MDNKMQNNQDPKISWKYTNKMPFLLPEGYFEEVDEKILSEIKIQLKFPNKTKPFRIPSEKYFEENVQNITSVAFLNSIDKEKKIAKSKMPSKYFDSFTNRLMDAIKEDEKKVNLNKEKKIATPLQVSESYFENLDKEILSKIHSQNNAEKNKNVAFPSKKKGFSWVWMAAALAIFIGLFGIYNKSDILNSSKNSNYFENQLASISKEEIAEYLNLPDGDVELNFSSKESEKAFEEKLNALSKADIEMYLVNDF
ncbi:MAG TPA: hypothetical protein VK027_01100 [Chitinophagaceae bacterium]|nr:hypothetical protein [Chitinophagaceae bacterium]